MPSILKQVANETNGDIGSSNLLQILHTKTRDEAANIFKTVPKGKLGVPIRQILDSLEKLPKVKVTEAKVTHTIDKDTRKSKGVLKVRLEVEQHVRGFHKDETSNFATLGLVLGTMGQRMLLAQGDVPVARGAQSNRLIEKQLDFDWDMANADGGEEGGSLLLRLVHDSIRGLDSEIRIGLH